MTQVDERLAKVGQNLKKFISEYSNVLEPSIFSF